jgi:hypothetical protein
MFSSQFWLLFSGNNICEHSPEWFNHGIVPLVSIESTVAGVINIISKYITIKLKISLLIDVTIGIADGWIQYSIWNIKGFNQWDILGTECLNYETNAIAELSQVTLLIVATLK